MTPKAASGLQMRVHTFIHTHLNTQTHPWNYVRVLLGLSPPFAKGALEVSQQWDGPKLVAARP